MVTFYAGDCFNHFAVVFFIKSPRLKIVQNDSLHRNFTCAKMFYGEYSSIDCAQTGINDDEYA